MSEYGISSLMAELSESAKTRSVLVSGIPTLTNEDKIEIYFGKRVNGGGDIEKIIMLDKSTALITFGEAKVIKSVIEHGSHKFYGQTVEVTSLSSMLKKSKVTQPTNTDDVQKSMSSYMSFSSVTEELTDSAKKRSVLVSGIPKTNNIEDKIELHFGKRIYGGGDIEKIIRLDKDKALITFCDEKVIKSVIDHGPHKLYGHTVKVTSLSSMQSKVTQPSNTDDVQKSKMSSYMSFLSVTEELTDSATKRSVLVSGLPKTNNIEDRIELHFGKRIYGGGDIEKIIMLDKDKALITFCDEKVIKSVIEHGSHKFYGHTVEVTSLSSMQSKVTQPTNTDDVQKSMSSYMSLLELTDSATKRSVLISGIPKTNNIEDKIELHFGKRVNGGGDIEKIIMLDKDKALITFCDEKVIKSVIEHGPHKLYGHNTVEVTPLSSMLKKSKVTQPTNTDDVQKSMSSYMSFLSVTEELTDSATKRSVLVSGLPKTNNIEDRIELHFGKRIYGGGDIEKIIMLDKDKALITFCDEKVIKSVIENGSHKFYGQTVEVTSLSSMLKKSKVNQPTNTDDVQKSKMSSYIKFLSVTEELTDSDKKRSLVVVGIPRITHVTYQIEKHFEKQKNGGGDIKNVYLLDTDAALITFCKENVIDLVIANSPHQFHGSEVEAMSCDTYRLNNSDVTHDSQLRPTRTSKTIKESAGQRETVEPFENVKVTISTKEHPHILDDDLSFLRRLSKKLDLAFTLTNKERFFKLEEDWKAKQEQFVTLEGDWNAVADFRSQMIKRSMLFKEYDDGNTQVDEEDAPHVVTKGSQRSRVTSTTEEDDDESRPRLGKRDGPIDGKEDDPDEFFGIDMPSQVPSRGTRDMNEFKKEETSQHYTTPSLPATSSNQPRVTSHGTRNMEEKFTQSYPNQTAYDRHFQTDSTSQPSHITSHGTSNMEEKFTQSYPNQTAYDRHFQTGSSNQPSHVTSHGTRNVEEEKFTQSYPTQQPNKTETYASALTKDTYPYSAGPNQPSEKSYLESPQKPILRQAKLQYPPLNHSSSSSSHPIPTTSKYFQQASLTNDIFNINNVQITGKVGDITKERVDVIVSSVDCKMIMGGGLTLAILRAGGEVIKQECQAWHRRQILSTSGKIFTVSSGSLPCKSIMFLVMPDCNIFKSFEENCKIMTQYCKEVLKSLHRIGARSAAIPGLGTGAFNYPLKVFVKGMLTAMHGELSSKSTLKNITLIDQKSYLLTELQKKTEIRKQGSEWV